MAFNFGAPMAPSRPVVGLDPPSSYELRTQHVPAG